MEVTDDQHNLLQPTASDVLVGNIFRGFHWSNYSCVNQNGETNSSPWTIKNVCKLVKYVALDDINQLRGCYLTNKIDPSVFVVPCRAAEMAAEAAEATKLNERLNLITWKPTVFVDAINHETTRNKNGHFIGPCGAASQKTANSYFTHITNFVAGEHANATKGRKFLEPSSLEKMWK